MTKKISFDLDKTISKVSRPSVFDRIVREIDAIEIPPSYIQSILIQYHDGSIIELEGSALKYPIPMIKGKSWDRMEELFKKMKDIKVFIATDRLEEDVNQMVEEYLGKYC